MITVLARFRVQPGKEEEARAMLDKMAASVQANEPGVLAYLAHQAKQDPSEVIFFERYADESALDTHSRSPHMGEFRAKFGEVAVAGSFRVELLDRVGGFERPQG